MGYLFLIVALVLNAAANVAIKVGSASFATWHEVGIVKAALLNVPLMAGVALFALNVVFYALALSRIPLSVGYPVMVVGGLLIVTLASVLYLRESLSFVHLLGLAFLLLGTVLVVQR